MNKLQQISEYFTNLSECGCGSAPMDILSTPPQGFQPNPQLSPNQLNNPNFIADIVAQVIQQLSNSNENMFTEEIDEGTCGYTHKVNPKTGRRGKELKTPGGTKGISALNRTNFMR
mgnify:CR=1 FL=1